MECTPVSLRRLVVLLWSLYLLCNGVAPVCAQPVTGGANFGTSGYSSGSEAAQRLQQEKGGKSTYRGGVQGGEGQVDQNLQQLFPEIQAGAANVEKFYSPHLRDIKEGIWRQGHAEIRAQPFKPECPFEDTSVYRTQVEDTNFKVCCVREGYEAATETKIACDFPNGDGWKGLFEYYYPTTVVGWENDRTTSMIIEKEKVDECLQITDTMMEDPNAQDWVAKAIERNIKAGDKATGGGGAQPNTSEMKNTIQGVISKVRPDKKSNQELRFSDSLAGEGLTVRLNFPALEEGFRRSLAEKFCMDRDQFGKLLDNENPYQRDGGDVNTLRNTVKPFTNYCPDGVTLMTKVDESRRLFNIDKGRYDFPGNATDFQKGMTAGFDVNPLYCQCKQMVEEDSYTTLDVQKEPLTKSCTGFSPSDEEVGYTCTYQSRVRMVPVELYSSAQVERRAFEHALPFLMAAGWFRPAGERSYYPRFEPREYFQFKGKAFKGGGPKEAAEGFCNALNTEQRQRSSDQALLSKETHTSFDQNPIRYDGNAGEGKQSKGFNRYQSQWTTDKHTAKRGLEKYSNNYAAAFRIFATCPKGWVPWKGPGSEVGACGEEKLW